jgi:hypothetical protein
MLDITFTRFVVLLSIIFLLIGCDKVRVIDNNGNPIVGAEVCAVGLTLSNGPNITDHNGFANIPTCIQEIKWISVNCKGYGSAYINVPKKYPLTISLNKTSVMSNQSLKGSGQ